MKRLAVGFVIALVASLLSIAIVPALCPPSFVTRRLHRHARVVRHGAVAGAVGSTVTVSSSDGRFAPAGGSQWVAIVDFARGGSGQLAFADLTVAHDGTWSGSLRIPSSAVLGPAQITAQCFDPAHSVLNQATCSPVGFTVTAGRFIAATDGAIGSVVTVRSTVGCVAPAGAGQ